eukprot:SAG31_NODE_29024_length_402_cov_0.627063_2_plen_35_part_01
MLRLHRLLWTGLELLSLIVLLELLVLSHATVVTAA